MDVRSGNLQLGYTSWQIFILKVQPAQEAQNHLYLATSNSCIVYALYTCDK